MLGVICGCWLALRARADHVTLTFAVSAGKRKVIASRPFGIDTVTTVIVAPQIVMC